MPVMEIRFVNTLLLFHKIFRKNSNLVLKILTIVMWQAPAVIIKLFRNLFQRISNLFYRHFTNLVLANVDSCLSINHPVFEEF